MCLFWQIGNISNYHHWVLYPQVGRFSAAWLGSFIHTSADLLKLGDEGGSRLGDHRTLQTAMTRQCLTAREQQCFALLLIVLFPTPLAKSSNVTCVRASETCVFLHGFPEGALLCVCPSIPHWEKPNFKSKVGDSYFQQLASLGGDQLLITWEQDNNMP